MQGMPHKLAKGSQAARHVQHRPASSPTRFARRPRPGSSTPAGQARPQPHRRVERRAAQLADRRLAHDPKVRGSAGEHVQHDKWSGEASVSSASMAREQLHLVYESAKACALAAVMDPEIFSTGHPSNPTTEQENATRKPASAASGVPIGTTEAADEEQELGLMSCQGSSPVQFHEVQAQLSHPHVSQVPHQPVWPPSFTMTAATGNVSDPGESDGSFGQEEHLHANAFDQQAAWEHPRLSRSGSKGSRGSVGGASGTSWRGSQRSPESQIPVSLSDPTLNELGRLTRVESTPDEIGEGLLANASVESQLDRREVEQEPDDEEEAYENDFEPASTERSGLE